jgi:hypothetical protein
MANIAPITTTKTPTVIPTTAPVDSDEDEEADDDVAPVSVDVGLVVRVIVSWPGTSGFVTEAEDAAVVPINRLVPRLTPVEAVASPEKLPTSGTETVTVV